LCREWKGGVPCNERMLIILTPSGMRCLDFLPSESCQVECLKLKALNYAKLGTRTRSFGWKLFLWDKGEKSRGEQSKLKAKSTRRSGVQTTNGGHNHFSECVWLQKKKETRLKIKFGKQKS